MLRANTRKMGAILCNVVAAEGINDACMFMKPQKINYFNFFSWRSIGVGYYEIN